MNNLTHAQKDTSERQHQAPKVAEQCVLQANPAYVTHTTADREYETIANAGERQHRVPKVAEQCALQANPAYVVHTTAYREYETIADPGHAPTRQED